MRPSQLLMSLSLLLLVLSCSQPSKSLTQEEISAFTKKLVSSVERKNPAFLNGAIDVNTFIKKMKLTGSLSTSDVRKALGTKLNFGENVVNSLTDKATYELVRQYEADGKHHVLMRLYDDGSMNYHDMELVRVKDECKVADIYIYSSGENLSKTMNDLFNDVNDVLDDRHGSQNNSWIGKVQRIRTLINQEEYEQAKELFAEIPASLQKNKAVQIANIQICSGLSSEEYDNALRQYESLFPNEPNTHLLMIDGYIMRKQYDKMIHSVDMLDSLLGGDPFLDYHRSIGYMNLGDEPTAKICLERLVKKFPDFEDGVLELIVYYLDDKEYDKAKKLVDAYEVHSGFDKSRLTSILSIYPDYNNY